jgi:hypothetical protein
LLAAATTSASAFRYAIRRAATFISQASDANDTHIGIEVIRESVVLSKALFVFEKP